MALRRRDQGRIQKSTVLIVCEGQLETRYFHLLKSHPQFRMDIRLEVHCADGGKHAKVLELAIGKARRSRFDRVWCVFDTEGEAEHPAVKSTVDKCKKKGFKVALSNPCFNVWILAHLNQWPDRPLKPDESRRTMREACGSDPAKLDDCRFRQRIFGGDAFPNLCTAQQKARPLSIDSMDAFLNNNPATNLRELINFLLQTGN